MVKLAAFSGLVAAQPCNKGIEYCGYNLLYQGNYYNEIVAELQQNWQGGDPQHVRQSHFHCGSDGWTEFGKYCDKGAWTAVAGPGGQLQAASRAGAKGVKSGVRAASERRQSVARASPDLGSHSPRCNSIRTVEEAVGTAY